MSISADGYVAGPGQCREHPLGVGGEALHDWHLGDTKDHPANRQVISEMLDGMGATIMGRNMFGPIRGPWGDSDWQGWWGDEPPYHHPVFVLTHHPRPDLAMKGTTFHFVTGSIESVLIKALDAADGRDVRLGGGVATVQQYLRAGLVDSLHIAVAPILLGAGERLLDASTAAAYKVIEQTPSTAVTHYRLARI
jgi:dihydrofolate reductase